MNYGGFPGFRFQPSDEELLSHYLQKKNQRKDPQMTAIIPEIDVSKHEPRDLPALVFERAQFLNKANSPEMEWYFFSPRVFKHSNSKAKNKSKSPKIDRSTKEGNWKKQGDDQSITGASSGQHIGGKRFLTFYLPKKQRTNWVIHEYYLTGANSDEQIGDFVLCRLKDKPLKNKKSGKSDHDQQDAPFCGGGSCSAVFNLEDQASGELGTAVIPNGNDDAAAHADGRSSDVESSASKQLEIILPIPEHGGGSYHIASGMLTEAELYLGFRELLDAVFESDGNGQELGGLHTCPPGYDENDHSVSVEDQPDSYNSPETEMVQELPHEPGALRPPATTQPQSSIYTKLGTNNFLCKRKCPFGDGDPFLTKKNHTDEVDSNTSCNSTQQAADAIPEAYTQPGGNLGSAFCSQELLSINGEPRDFPHDNILIGWDGFPPIIEGFDYPLDNFSETFIDGIISDNNIEVTYGESPKSPISSSRSSANSMSIRSKDMRKTSMSSHVDENQNLKWRGS